MRISHTLLATALGGAVLLAGCTTATPYRPAIGTGYYKTGFSDERIEPNRYRVSFSGNSMTARDTVERYLLFRAAQLTVEQGFDYFVLANRDTEKQSRTYVDRPFGGSAAFGYGGYGGYWGPSWRYYSPRFGWRGWSPWGGDPFWDRDIDVRTVDKYEATGEIVMGKGSKPADNVRAFDARAVIDNLGPSIIVPK